jgi:hypothetical protein
MDERKRLQFSVWNLMLMMVPLGVVFGLASQAGSLAPAVWILGLYVGCFAAVGALVGGLRGMLLGLGWFAVANIVLGAVLFLLSTLAIFVGAIAGVVRMSVEGWSIGVAMCVAVAVIVLAMVRGFRGR